jgi:hypothetical protein
VIATPTRTIRIKRPSAAPVGIDWMRLSADDLEEMPILADLKRMTTSNAKNTRGRGAFNRANSLLYAR